MKKLLCLIFVLSFAMAGSAFADAVKIHEWKMDGNLLDTSGSGNDGVMNMDPLPFVQGLVNECLVFDSNSHHLKNVTASNLPVVSTDAWSINMFLYSPTAPYWTALGGFGDYLYTSTDGETRYLLHGSNNFQFWGYNVDMDFGSPWTPNKWQMTTITFSGSASGTMKFYLDGVEVYSESNISSLTDAAPELHLAPPLWGHRYTGKIDEFTVWSGVLTQTQIDELTLALGPAKNAWEPIPVDGAPIKTGYRAVAPSVVPSWKAPLDVDSPVYNVYFGTDPCNLVLESESQSETSFDPYGLLDLDEGTLYYWRIDVNDPNGGNPVIHTGDVWSFTTWESTATKALEWKMDASSGTVADDSTANNNDGTLIGNPQWVEGLVGNCLEFDGDTDAVEVVSASGLPVNRTDAWSINVYLYSQWLQKSKVIAGFGDPNGGVGEVRYLMNARDERFQFWGEHIDVYAEAVLDLGEWQMLTITYEGSDANDSGELRVYENGVEKAYDLINFWEHDALAEAYLSPGVWGNYFSGKIDEFTIWQGALTPSQIEQLAEVLPVPGDITGDGDVDFKDFAILAANWLYVQ